MRFVSYKDGYKFPVIGHADNTANVGDILGGEIRPDGSVLLYVLRQGNYEVVVVPNVQWPEDLDDAMLQRYEEANKHKNPYKHIKPTVGKMIIAQPDAALWAMELDPESVGEDWSVNARIRTLREVLQLSQYDFAEKIGIDWIKLAHIEENACPVTYELMKTIVNTFNVRERWLAKGDGCILVREAQKDEVQDE